MRASLTYMVTSYATVTPVAVPDGMDMDLLNGGEKTDFHLMPTACITGAPPISASRCLTMLLPLHQG